MGKITSCCDAGLPSLTALQPPPPEQLCQPPPLFLPQLRAAPQCGLWPPRWRQQQSARTWACQLRAQRTPKSRLCVAACRVLCCRHLHCAPLIKPQQKGHCKKNTNTKSKWYAMQPLQQGRRNVGRRTHMPPTYQRSRCRPTSHATRVRAHRSPAPRTPPARTARYLQARGRVQDGAERAAALLCQKGTQLLCSWMWLQVRWWRVG